MLAYIVSVAGICVLTVLLDIILPEGNMNKYIKSVFSVLVIIVVISPVVKALRSDIDFDMIFRQEGATYQTDGNFIIATNAAVLDTRKQAATKLLDAGGYTYAGMDVIACTENTQKVSYVNVFIYSDSIKDKDKNIYIQNVQEVLGNFFRIERTNIRVILW